MRIPQGLASEPEPLKPLTASRLRTMSDAKLQRRIWAIKRIDKMEDFIQV